MTTKERFEKNVLPYFNIKEYWDKGFTGKGITIATMEETKEDHGSNVVDTCLTYAPDCRVISFTDEKNYSAMSDDGKHIAFPEFVNWCIEHDVDIVTSSLDWSCDKDVEKEAIKKLYDAGIIFCNCASNEGSEIKPNNTKKTWGFDKEVISVSGISINVNGKISWSGFNYGEAVDVCTMGSNTPTISRENGSMYSWSGTSVATPMCAAMIALYKSYDKTLNSKNVFEKLIDKMTNTIEYKGFTHKILVLPKIENEVIEMPEQKEENKPSWKVEFEEVWERATQLKVVDGSRPNDPITRNELMVVLDRLGLLK